MSTKHKCRHAQCTGGLNGHPTEIENIYKLNQHEKTAKCHQCCKGAQRCKTGLDWEAKGVHLPEPAEVNMKFQCRHAGCNAVLKNFNSRFKHERNDSIHDNFKSCGNTCEPCQAMAQTELQIMKNMDLGKKV